LAAAQVAHAAELAAERDARKNVEAERDRLRAAYDELKIQADLAKHRITIAKAERIDTTQLEIEFATKLAELDALAGMVGDPAINREPAAADDPSSPSGGGKKLRRKGTGRRNLALSDLPEQRVEVIDPVLDPIAERIGFEESLIIGYQRGGPIRIRVARVKYKVPEHVLDADLTMPGVITAPAPLSLLPKSMAAPSLISRIATEKFCWGMPLHRIEQRLALEGFPLSRGTMSRWIEQAGAVIGATLVEAMRREALATAFCIATDATGILVQPTPRDDRKPQPCERAHMFVQIADADAVFFEFTPRENSEFVSELFRGFAGMVQADAKSVFDVLYRRSKEPGGDPDPDAAACTEVACWSHARTKYWETAIATQHVVAREALARVMRMFQYDRAWKSLPPAERKAKRDRHLRPHVIAFFEFAEPAFARAKLEDPRGMLARALGYSVRQRDALMRFLDDGRLEMTNNHSERQLRKIATGRNAWLFVGSHDHGQAAANFLTVIASARLHRLDPEIYLRDLCRVLPHWPRQRYIELAPRYWRTTRARLNAVELANEAGPMTVPEQPLPTLTHVQREL